MICPACGNETKAFWSVWEDEDAHRLRIPWFVQLAGGVWEQREGLGDMSAPLDCGAAGCGGVSPDDLPLDPDADEESWLWHEREEGRGCQA